MTGPATITPHILALFTLARRRFLRLTHAQLASQLGLRTDQIASAEAKRNPGRKARAKLIEFNELEAWDA